MTPPRKPRTRGVGRQAAGSAKSDARRAAIIRRQREVFDLRDKELLSWHEIADRVGISHVQAQRDYDAALEDLRVPPEDRDRARRRILDQLRDQKRRLIQVQNRDHFAHSFGKPIMLPDADGVERPVLDDGPIIQAAGKFIAALLAEARISGALAPVQTEHVTPDTIDAYIDRRARELGFDPSKLREQALTEFRLIEGGAG